MDIEFSGAAGGEVTGSCHILRANGKTVLLDCGLLSHAHITCVFSRVHDGS